MTQRVALGTILHEVLRPELVVAETEYPVLGVRSFGGGCFDAGSRRGSETRYEQLLKVHSGDVIYPKLMAWEGAFAVVPQEYSGYYVSPEFCLFEHDPESVEIDWFKHFLRTPALWIALGGASTGTNLRRRRLYPESFLSREILLPEIEEQRRVARLLDGVFTALGRAHQLSVLAGKRAERLRWSWLKEQFQGITGDEIKLEDAVTFNPETIDPIRDMSGEFSYIDISSISKGKGTIVAPSRIPVAEAPSRARRRVRSGDVLLSTVRPNLRGFATVPDALDGAVCSTGLAVLRPHPAMDSEFLLLQALSDRFVDQLVSDARGGHYPAVSEKRLRKTWIVRPTVREQREHAGRMRSMLDRFDRFQQLKQDIDGKLAAVRDSLLNSSFDEYAPHGGH